MKVWITKYTLTRGIFEAETIEIKDKSAVVSCPGGLNDRAMYHRDEWHLSLKDAKKKAESMKINKIKNLEKQLKKIRDLDFGA